MLHPIDIRLLILTPSSKLGNNKGLHMINKSKGLLEIARIGSSLRIQQARLAQRSGFYA